MLTAQAEQWGGTRLDAACAGRPQARAAKQRAVVAAGRLLLPQRLGVCGAPARSGLPGAARPASTERRGMTRGNEPVCLLGGGRARQGAKLGGRAAARGARLCAR